MNVTPKEASEAEVLAQRQRHQGARFLLSHDDRATPSELEVISRLREATKYPADYDAALDDPIVRDLFNRGILYFAVANG